MSYLVRWVRQNQSLANRSASLLTGQAGVGAILDKQTIKPLYQITASHLATSSVQLQKASERMSDNGNKKERSGSNPSRDGKIKDDIQYTIKFKDVNFKETFKKFYSLYGPIFLASHIGVSLCSLGFFCSLAHFAIDMSSILPDLLVERIGHEASMMTGTSGKFLVAYAVHKVLLPLRLVCAIWLTRFISMLVEARRAPKTK